MLNAIKKFSSYLWGIETLEKQRQNKHKRKFSSYLWGIETFLAFCSTPFNSVFILPMRNWNSKESADCWNRLGFHLTYEELKLSLFFTISVLPMNVFILPMRNWNFLVGLICWNPLDRFHLTYEELKQCTVSFVRMPGHVFILPMRNWNRQRKRFYNLFRFGVFILPMRNWNFR